MRNTKNLKEVKQKTPKKEEAMKPNYKQKARHPSEIRRGSLSTLTSFARAPNGQGRWETTRLLLMN